MSLGFSPLPIVADLDQRPVVSPAWRPVMRWSWTPPDATEMAVLATFSAMVDPGTQGDIRLRVAESGAVTPPIPLLGLIESTRMPWLNADFVSTTANGGTTSVVLEARRTLGSGGVTVREAAATVAPAILAVSPPVFYSQPVIIGSAVLGGAVVSTIPNVSGFPSPVVTYQWIVDGVDVAGATTRAFTIPLTATTVQVRATATNASGTLSVLSSLVYLVPGQVGVGFDPDDFDPDDFDTEGEIVVVPPDEEEPPPDPEPVIINTETWAYTNNTRTSAAIFADGFTATGQALYLTPRPADGTWPGTLVSYRTWDPGVDRQIVPEWADTVPDGFAAGPATGQWWHVDHAPADTPIQRTFRSPNGYPDFFGGNETAAFALQTAELPNGTRAQTMFQELDFLIDGEVVTHRMWVSNFTVANVTAPPPEVSGVVTLDLATHDETAMGVVVKAGSSAADRGDVLSTSVGGRTGTFWRARHPGPSSSTRWGTDWRCAFDRMAEPIPPSDEMWFAYDMHHQTDWNTAQNAPGDRKMPCLAGYDSTVGRIGDVDNSGSSTEAHREDQWTARWMTQGRSTADIQGLGYLNVWKLGTTLHNDNRASTNSGITSFYSGLRWSVGGTPVNIPKGWATVEQYVKMNTPGQSNGIIRWWLNGVLVCERTDVGYRSASHPNLRINAWNAVMFWGGPVPAENPTEATQTFFDNFRFSTAGRIT